jgi:HemY protein
MFRIFFYILVVAGISYGLSLIEGDLTIQWAGGQIEPSLRSVILVLFAVFLLLMVIWSVFRMIMSSPEAFSRYLSVKKKKKGIDALSSGLIALGSGDDIMAQRYAMQAKKTLPNDPMTLMLRAQAAELKGDIQQATKLYESMLAASDTEIFGLRGLYMLAFQQNEIEAAAQYAARAVQRRPDLSWAVLGLFDLQCKKQAWRAALDTLKIATSNGHVQAKKAKRQRAVLLTALAIDLEDSDMDEALKLATEASRLAPALIPASVVAGRVYASKGQMSPALKVLRKCWKLAPHPDLAVVSAFARPGDSVRDRLDRIKSLARLTPGHKEAALAVGTAAIEAQDWASAREALGPLTRGRPTQRVCTLMARIEAADGGDIGSVQEWLARGIHAMPDPQWIADGVVADEWGPLSPINQKLDGFEWKVPPEDDIVSEETHTLKKLLSDLVTAEGLTAQRALEATADVTEAESSSSDMVLVPVVKDTETDTSTTSDFVEKKDKKNSDDASAVVSIVGDDKEDDHVVSSAEMHQGELNAEDVDIEEDIEPLEQGQKSESKIETDIEIDVDASVSEASVDKEPESSNLVAAKRSADKVETEEKAKSKSKRKRRKRTKIFVAPPAPDDPGTEDHDDLELVDRVRPVRF